MILAAAHLIGTTMGDENVEGAGGAVIWLAFLGLFMYFDYQMALAIGGA